MGALLQRCRDRLRRMVALRLDRRLQGRIDPSDVIQESYIEASARLPEYVENPVMPFFLWLRFIRANGSWPCTFNQAGDLLASVGWEATLRLWDPRTGKQLFSTRAEMKDVRFSPDDRLLAAEVRGSNLRLFEIVRSREYRTVVANPAARDEAFNSNADLDASGQLLAGALHQGVHLWDLGSGAEVAWLRDDGYSFAPLFQPQGLLIGSLQGLKRWPVHFDKGAIPRIGRSQLLAVAGPTMPLVQSSDGRVLAVSRPFGAMVLDGTTFAEQARLSPHDDVRFIAVSPNGRWVATGSHGGDKVGAKVWDARDGTLLAELPGERICRVQFSGDNRWLATGGSRCRLWRAESWQPGPEIEGIERVAMAFSPDHRLLAVETGEGIIRLVDPNTGRDYARLEDPNQDRAIWLGFTPDAAKLVCISNDGPSIHIWDLRLIRTHLANLGLDLGLPSEP
jgi:WD40 repeat protein